MSLRNIVLTIAVLIVGLIGGYYAAQKDSDIIAEIPAPVTEAPEEAAPAAHDELAPGVSGAPENAVVFTCTDGSFTAVFARDVVGITLDDDRQYTLRQTDATEGVRYEDAYNRVVFTGTDESAYLMESSEITYSNCRVRE